MKKKIIDVIGLTKKYNPLGPFALDHIDLSINEGSIFGLLGPNGAGKSTFINILSGLSNKTSGLVLVSELKSSSFFGINSFFVGRPSPFIVLVFLRLLISSLEIFLSE